MTNNRFTEYATSGAFNLTLSRNQISALSLLVPGGYTAGFSHSEAALERKGLIEFLPGPSPHFTGHMEARPTTAGLLVISLLAEAGMSNHVGDTISEEIDSMRGQMIEAREKSADLYKRLVSAISRKWALENELYLARHEIENMKSIAETGKRLKMKIPMPSYLEDPLPGISDSDLLDAPSPLMTADEPPMDSARRAHEGEA